MHKLKVFSILKSNFMSKMIFTLLILFTITGKIISQKTEVELLMGYQKHDKRFYGHFSEENAEKEGNWGTSYWGFNVNRNILQLEKFDLRIGLGYARETNTYSTPYDHCFDNPDQPCFDALIFIGKYSVDMIFASITPKLNLIKNLDLGLNMFPQFYFYKKVNGVTSDFNFGLYSLEFIPELEYNIGSLNIGLGFRVFQFKTIDEVYIYGNEFLTKNPGYLEKKFDTYNPTKFILAAGYRFGIN